MGDPNAGVVSSSAVLELTYQEQLEVTLQKFIDESNNSELCDEARTLLASKTE